MKSKVDLEETCSQCNEKFISSDTSLKLADCSHLFHSKWFDNLQDSISCPKCNKSLRKNENLHKKTHNSSEEAS